MRALPVLLAALIVAGCGARESDLEGSDEALKDAATSRVEWRLEGKNLTEWGDFSSTGSIDYAHNIGELVMENKINPKLNARVIFIGRDSYMGTTYHGKMLWQKSSDSRPVGVDRLAPGPGGTRPDEVLDALVKSSEKVERLGKDEIRGVPATHYRAHIDARKLGIASELYGPDGPVIDAWIDDDGLMRRIRLPYGGPEAPVGVVDLYDFGVPVSVERPPEDQVLSQDEFLKLMWKECEENGDEADDVTVGCALFGGSGWTSYGSGTGEIAPVETIPRTVTDPE